MAYLTGQAYSRSVPGSLDFSAMDLLRRKGGQLGFIGCIRNTVPKATIPTEVFNNLKRREFQTCIFDEFNCTILC